MTEPTQRRRRFQFRLRTLMIIVTLNCVCVGWLGMQASIVWERRAMLNRLPGGYAVDDDGSGISWIRHLFGDQGIGIIQIGGSPSDEQLDCYRTAFPEACIFRTRGPLPKPGSRVMPVRSSGHFPPVYY
jgi:hypothetical protein